MLSLVRNRLNNIRNLSSIVRDVQYARVVDSDLRIFESIVGAENVKTEDLDGYNRDWSKWYKGKAPCVLLPSSSDEVSAILSHCAKRKIAVVPQAGNTGLVGGSIPVHDEIIISVKRINKLFKFDDVTGILTCDAGLILEDLDNRLASFGYMMPFDLGAKGSCMIGGNIATCAGGIRLLRYGSLHAHLLGLTVVLPDYAGSVLDLGSPLRKDNTSLHTPHLFLGSEGQLGIITRVVMNVVPRPRSVHSAMLGTDSFDACRAILSLARSRLSEVLSSFEFLDRETMTVLRDNLQLSPVLSSDPRFCLLIETSGSDSAHDNEKMQRFLEECISNGLISDGVQAQSSTEASDMWLLRESAPLAVASDGWVYKHDVSLPLQHFYELTEEIRSRFSHLTKRIMTYGHLGDGNSHLNITTDEYSQQLYDELYPFLYEWVVSHGGSISAEHGIGQLKRPYSHLGKQSAERLLIHQIKKLFDPYAIMNPYKMLHYSEQSN